jgi:hypothetical protein
MATVIHVLTEHQVGGDIVDSHPTWTPRSPMVSASLAAASARALLQMPAGEVAHVHLSERGAFLREGSLVALARRRGLVTVATDRTRPRCRHRFAPRLLTAQPVLHAPFCGNVARPRESADAVCTDRLVTSSGAARRVPRGPRPLRLVCREVRRKPLVGPAMNPSGSERADSRVSRRSRLNSSAAGSPFTIPRPRVLLPTCRAPEMHTTRVSARASRTRGRA